MYQIFIDLEMRQVCQEFREKPNYCHNEIIQVGAVCIDRNLKEIGSFCEYVKPKHPLIDDDYSERITGITLPMLKNAMRIEEVLPRLSQWCRSFGKAFVVNSWSGADKGQILAEMKAKRLPMSPEVQSMIDRWNDFQKDFDKLTKASHQTSLSDAVRKCGLSFEGKEHDALWDARATAEVYRITRDKENFLENVQE